MNRYLALLLASFILGGALGAVTGMWLYSLHIEDALRERQEKLDRDAAKKIGKTMRWQQMCVKAVYMKPECVDWGM